MDALAASSVISAPIRLTDPPFRVSALGSTKRHPKRGCLSTLMSEAARKTRTTVASSSTTTTQDSDLQESQTSSSASKRDAISRHVISRRTTLAVTVVGGVISVMMGASNPARGVEVSPLTVSDLYLLLS
jgi:hypothetical protein